MLGTTVFAGDTSVAGYRTDMPVDMTCTLTEIPASGWVLESSGNTTVSPGAGSASFTNRHTAEDGGQGGAPGQSGGMPLATTGTGHARWLLAGMLLLAVGLVALAVDRRRRRHLVSNGSGPSC